MTKKNLVQVVIGGKVLSMCGSEDELHIQKVASCVNRKLSELEPTEAYRALPADLKPVLVELNLADELVMAQDTIEMLKTDLQAMGNELSEVKQKLVETQMELEELESSAVQMTFSDVGWMPEQASREMKSAQMESAKSPAEAETEVVDGSREDLESSSAHAKNAAQKPSVSGRRKSGKR